MVWEAGAEHGIRDFGLYAMDSLRLEKCYRGWKQDLSTEWSALGGRAAALRQAGEVRRFPAAPPSWPSASRARGSASSR